MKKRTIKQWTAVVLLVLLAAALISVVHVRAVYETNDDGVCWYWMNKSHEGAEIARALGGDNQQVLAYFGRQWTDWNNLRKEIVERKQAEARRAEEEKKANMEYLGNWTLTAYANDGQSASGRANIPGQTCACNCLPFGTVIEVEGMGRFTVTDRGASSGSWSWHNSGWCDLYLGSERECQQFGVQKRQVWVVK